MLRILNLPEQKGICFCVFFLLPIFSCTKELDIALPEGKSLVLNSIFNPDSVFSFHLSYTSSSLEEYKKMDSIFQLKLYEDEYLLIDTVFNGGIYRTNKRPSQKTKYYLEITSSGVPPIYAEDSIPKRIKIDDAYLIFPAGTDNYGDYLAEANITFTDPPEQKNFYELLIYHENEGHRSYWFFYIDNITNDIVLSNEGDITYNPTSFFFSDELINGESYTVKVKGYGGYYNTMEFIVSTKIYATLRSVSKSYYLYRKYYTRHAYNQQFQGDFLDLVFRGEPQTMFTNIENGYGIFAGYQESTKKLYHKE